MWTTEKEGRGKEKESGRNGVTMTGKENRLRTVQSQVGIDWNEKKEKERKLFVVDLVDVERDSRCCFPLSSSPTMSARSAFALAARAARQAAPKGTRAASTFLAKRAVLSTPSVRPTSSSLDFPSLLPQSSC
jgi:hypothetical protein